MLPSMALLLFLLSAVVVELLFDTMALRRIAHLEAVLLLVTEKAESDSSLELLLVTSTRSVSCDDASSLPKPLDVMIR